MNRSDALANLRLMAAADVAPTLTDDELNRALDRCRVADRLGYAIERTASAWAAGAAYAVDDEVLPNVFTGLKWRCTIAGTSGASEPDWPAALGDTIADGTATWEGVATLWEPTYDLHRAAIMALRWKIGKASGDIDYSADGASVKRSQVIDHCKELIAELRRGRVGNLGAASWAVSERRIRAANYPADDDLVPRLPWVANS